MNLKDVTETDFVLVLIVFLFIFTGISKIIWQVKTFNPSLHRHYNTEVNKYVTRYI